MKKLINGTGTLLEESLAGFAAAHAGIVTLGEEGKFVRRRDLKRANFDFHFGLYRLSKMPALIGMIENLWIQHGPMLNYLYPEGHPTYEREHQHVYMLRAMRERDAEALCRGVRDDLIEGGRQFVAHLVELERREAEAGK